MCPFTMTLVLLAVVAALCYVFLVWNFGYWKKRGVKEAISYPFVGSFPSQFTQKQNVVYDVDEMYRQYKNTENFVGVYNCRTPQLLVLSKEYAHKVFVNDFKNFHDNEFANFVSKKSDVIFANNVFTLRGEEWKERRAEITPGLKTSSINAVYPITKEVSKSLAKYIKDEIKIVSKGGIDAKDLALRYTTEVVSDVVLGIKSNSFSSQPLPMFGMIKNVFEQSYSFIVYTAIANLLPIIRKFYVARLFSKETEKFLFDLMKQSIQLRRKTNIKREDFLNYILYLEEKKQLSTVQLTAHTITFLTDGFETMALVLSHTLLLLGRYPEIQEKLRAEIGTDDISFEQLTEMPYIDAVIHETIRIFSPLLLGRKICTQPYEFVNKDGSTVQVNIDDVVIVPVHSIQHDPEIYEEPEVFKPERFLPENGGVRKYREMGAYFGFGDGPRVCLGMRFALTQIKTALVAVIRGYNVKVNPKTRKDNYLNDTYFMAELHGGIWLDFEERK